MKIKIDLGGQPVVLRVPEGVDPGEYAEQVESKFLGQEKYSAASDSGFENFAAGMTQGVANIGRQVGNVAGLVSDEEMARYKAQDQDLLDTGAGSAGALVGEIAATAPIGMGLARGASSALVKGAPMLARTLSNPAAVAALDNAATGALTAGPGNRLEGAAKGAAISGTMSLGGKVLKRAVMKPWVTKTADAVALENMTGHYVPLSQAAEPGVWKQIYEGLVANIPGAGGKLRGQYDKALQDFREFVVEEASPPGANRIPTVGSHDMQKIMGDLKAAWDNKYASFTINQYPIKYDVGTPRGLYRRLPSAGVPVPKKGDVVMAKDLMDLRQTVQDIIDELPAKERVLKAQLTAYKDDLWKNIKSDIDPTGRGKTPGGKELKEYESLAPYYRKFKDVEAAAQKALNKSSEFSPEQLAKASAERAGPTGVAGGGALADEARIASGALKPFPSRQGVFQTAAAMGMTAAMLGGHAVGGPVGAVLAMGLPIAAGRALASKRVQRALTGDTKTQRVLAKAINSQKKNLKRAARVAGKVATIEATEE